MGSVPPEKKKKNNNYISDLNLPGQGVTVQWGEQCPAKGCQTHDAAKPGAMPEP